MALPKIKSKRGSRFRAPAPPRSEEKEFRELMAMMVDEATERFRVNAIEELNQETIQKFAGEDRSPFTDANFAREFTRLANKVKQSIMQQFSNDRLEKEVERIMRQADKRNRRSLYGSLQRRIGVDETDLIKREGLTWQANARIAETTEWVKKLRDESLAQFHHNSLHAMANGQNMDEVVNEFRNTASKRKDHVKFLARTQIANFNSQMTRLRAQNLGITKAVWQTSSDERVRRCHEVRDGKEFELEEGLYSSCDGKTLWPGSDYQCFPGSIKVDHATACQKLYRRWYTGELAEIVRDDGIVLHATPNHPILTVSGFKPAGEIDVGDNIVCAIEEGVNGIKFYANDMVPTFEELFRAIDLLGIEHTVAPAVSGKFHGDSSDSDVDVVGMDRLLVDKINPSIREKFAELDLSFSDKVIVLEFFTCLSNPEFRFELFGLSSDRIMRCLDLFHSSFLAHLTPLELFGFSLGAWADPAFEKALSDDITRNAEMFSDCVFAMAVLVHGDDLIRRKVDSFRSTLSFGNLEPSIPKFFGEGGSVNPDLFGGEGYGMSVGYKTLGVVDSGRVNFSGHIYNLQTISGDYTANTTAVSNCRCTYELIIPGEENE